MIYRNLSNWFYLLLFDCPTHLLLKYIGSVDRENARDNALRRYLLVRRRVWYAWEILEEGGTRLWHTSPQAGRHGTVPKFPVTQSNMYFNKLLLKVPQPHTWLLKHKRNYFGESVDISFRKAWPPVVQGSRWTYGTTENSKEGSSVKYLFSAKWQLHNNGNWTDNYTNFFLSWSQHFSQK